MKYLSYTYLIFFQNNRISKINNRAAQDIENKTHRSIQTKMLMETHTTGHSVYICMFMTYYI